MALFEKEVLSINLGPHGAEGMRQARGIVAIGMKATGFVALGVFIAKGIFAIGYKSIGIAAVGLDALEIISLYR